MSGLFDSLHISVTALQAFQTAMQTTSNNMANISTPGYSEQQVILAEAANPLQGSVISPGRGVVVAGIQRLRNQFLDTQLQNGQAASQQADTLQQTYSVLETTFQEPSTNGLSEGLDKFFNAFQQLTTNPNDLSARVGVQTQAQNLTAVLNSLHSQLNSQTSALNDQINSQIATLNGLTQQLATLNTQIKGDLAQGQSPNDLLDARQQVITQITGLTGATAIHQSNGEVDLVIQGSSLVDSAGAHVLAAIPRSGDPLKRVDIQDTTVNKPVTFTGGTLKGLFDSRDTVIPQFSGQLDTLAQTLISQVNAVHRQGVGLNGSLALTGANAFAGTLAANGSLGINGITINFAAGDDVNAIASKITAQSAATGVQASVSSGHLVLSPSASSSLPVQITSDPNGLAVEFGFFNDFFTGTGAGDIALSAAIASNPNLIAASLSGAPGDNSNAIALANLSGALTMNTGSQTFSQYYQSTIAQLGAQSASASASSTNQKAALDQISTLQQSASGVSIDQEVANLMMDQRAFQAASRVISTTDQMLNTLLNIQ